jgi:hypothetical protein
MQMTPRTMSPAPSRRIRPNLSRKRRIPPRTPAMALTWRTEVALDKGKDYVDG